MGQLGTWQLHFEHPSRADQNLGIMYTSPARLRSRVRDQTLSSYSRVFSSFSPLLLIIPCRPGEHWIRSLYVQSTLRWRLYAHVAVESKRKNNVNIGYSPRKQQA